MFHIIYIFASILLMSQMVFANEAFIKAVTDVSPKGISSTSVGMGNIPELSGTPLRVVTLEDYGVSATQRIRNFNLTNYRRDVASINQYWEQLSNLTRQFYRQSEARDARPTHLHEGMRAVLRQHQTLLFEGHARIEDLLKELKDKRDAGLPAQELIAEIQDIQRQQGTLIDTLEKFEKYLPHWSIYKTLGLNEKAVPSTKRAGYRQLYASDDYKRLMNSKNLASKIDRNIDDVILRAARALR